MERQAVQPGTITREREAPPIEIGGPWVVILYNCDCHTFDEVIAQLQVATCCSQATAEQVAEEAHQRGRAIAYTGDEEDCMRVAQVLRSIRLQVETDLF